MSLVLQSKLISLNSKDGTARNNLSGSYLSDLFFPFKSVLQIEKDIAYSTISIQSVEMANSFYNINTNNNTIKITKTIASNGNTSSHTITIPIGNYSASSFKTEFNTQILAQTGVVSTLALNNNNGIYSLTPANTTFTITILSTSTSLNVLGLSSGVDKTFTNGGNNVFNFACNFLGVTQLKIFSNSFSCSNLDSAGLSQNNLIDVISVSAPSYSLITYDSHNQESELKNKIIDGVDILILDANNQQIDFNFINWNITFLLNTYRVVDVSKYLSPVDFKDVLAEDKKEEPVIISPPPIKKVEIKKIVKPKIDKELDILLSS